jgi:ketosteroid isomerase-like protein
MRTFLLAASLLTVAFFISGCQSTPAHQENAVLRQFISRYFSTWSAQDMAGYESCFARESRIFFLPKDRPPLTIGLTDFIHQQTLAHQTEPERMTERAVDIQLSGDSRVVHAVVRWELSKGKDKETGMDFFTLIKQGSEWKILSLTFYGDDKPEAPVPSS